MPRRSCFVPILLQTVVLLVSTACSKDGAGPGVVANVAGTYDWEKSTALTCIWEEVWQLQQTGNHVSGTQSDGVRTCDFGGSVSSDPIAPGAITGSVVDSQVTLIGNFYGTTPEVDTLFGEVDSDGDIFSSCPGPCWLAKR